MTHESGNVLIAVITLRAASDLPAIEHLRAWGYAVELAADVHECLRLSPARKPSLVLFDLNPADPGSFPVLAGIREMFTGPLAVLSACTQESSHVLALERGADDYIMGTAGPDLVRARIKVLLRQVRNGQDVSIPNMTLEGPARGDAGREDQLRRMLTLVTDYMA